MMKILRARKGNIVSIIFIMAIMFIVGLMGLLSITMWNNFNNIVQNVDNESIPQNVKDQIDDLDIVSKFADKLFTLIFVVVLILYLIIAAISPRDKPIFFIFFAILLIFGTVVCMIFSNTWAFLIEQDVFSAAALDLPFTDFFMRFYPVIMLIIGVLGAILYYSRSSDTLDAGSGGGDKFGFE